MVTCGAPPLVAVAMALLDLADAHARLAARLTPVTRTEMLPIASALGRVTANEVRAPAPIPAFANSAMDGYAVRWQPRLAAPPMRLRCIGESFAGHPFSGELANVDDCVRIFTGAPLPPGADTVVVQEDTERNGEHITIGAVIRAGQWVRGVGHDLPAGAEVVASGALLRAQHLGMCVAAGLSHIAVRRRVRVGVFSNGDELVPPGTPLGPGQIYDSNRLTLLALLAQEPVEAIDLGRAADDRAAIAGAFVAARDADLDLLLCSGGVSVGDADLVREVLADYGSIDFWRIAVKPGKPLAFASLFPERALPTWFIGLPGNPVSTFVTYQLLVRQAIASLAGIATRPMAPLRVALAEAIAKDPGRLEWQRGVLFVDADGTTKVRSTGNQSSGMLSSIVAANCFVELPREQGDLATGEFVRVLPFEGTLS